MSIERKSTVETHSFTGQSGEFSVWVGHKDDGHRQWLYDEITAALQRLDAMYAGTGAQNTINRDVLLTVTGGEVRLKISTYSREVSETIIERLKDITTSFDQLAAQGHTLTRVTGP